MTLGDDMAEAARRMRERHGRPPSQARLLMSQTQFGALRAADLPTQAKVAQDLTGMAARAGLGLPIQVSLYSDRPMRHEPGDDWRDPTVAWINADLTIEWADGAPAADPEALAAQPKMNAMLYGDQSFHRQDDDDFVLPSAIAELGLPMGPLDLGVNVLDEQFVQVDQGWVQLDPGGTLDVAEVAPDGSVVEYHGPAGDWPGPSEQPEVVDGVPTDEAPFVHTAVLGRYPSGTDPLAAINDSMRVFMERTDGTNAMGPEKVRWWHGGPSGFQKGTMLRPPSETGVVPGLEFSDRDAVYVTSDRSSALMFAARFDRPMLYEVDVLGVEPDVDDVIPHEATSRRVPRATVTRVEQPSKLELRRVLYELSAESTDPAGPDVVDR